jgi:hypothetical protein
MVSRARISEMLFDVGPPQKEADRALAHLAFVNRSDFGINRLANFQQALRVLMEHPAHPRFWT